MQHKYPTGAYQLSETIFEQLEDVKINVPLELSSFSHLIILSFESITLPDNTIRNTELTPRIRKHVPISVSISSNLLTQPIFICNEDPLQLSRDFVSCLANIAEKSTLLIWEKLQNFTSRLEENYWLPRDKDPVRENEGLVNDDAETDEEDEEDSNFTRDRRELKVLSSLRQDLENYYNTIPVFGCNSSRYDLNLIK